jgi:hypothetical protein
VFEKLSCYTCLRDGLFKILQKLKLSLYHSLCGEKLEYRPKDFILYNHHVWYIYYLVGQISVGVKKGPLHNVPKGPAFPPNLNN